MANTITDVAVNHDDWMEATAIDGITEGEAFDVSNVSRYMVPASYLWLRIAAAKPDVAVKNGKLITTMECEAHTFRVQDGESKVWLRAVSSMGARVNLQPVAAGDTGGYTGVYIDPNDTQDPPVVPPVTDPGFDIILLSGQSNMVGFDGPIDPILDASDPDIFMRGYYENAIELATEPFDHVGEQPNTIGLGLTFAKLWKANRLDPGRQILILPNAVSGSGFNNGFWRQGGQGFNDVVLRASLAMAEGTGTNRLVAILWHQGEADNGILTGAQYQTDIDNLVTLWRSNLAGATSTTPFILGRIKTTSGGYNAGIDAAHLGITDRLVHTAVVETEDLALSDGLHFDAPSLRIMGQRYFDAVAAAEANTTVIPPPTASNATFRIQTTGANQTFSIPVNDDGVFNASIDWGDSSSSAITAFDDTALSHTFASAGTYDIEITGSFPNIAFGNSAADAARVIQVSNLGTIGLATLKDSFSGCVNMTSFSSGDCDTSLIQEIDGMLRNCSSLTAINVSTMDVSSVTNSAECFSGCSAVTSLDLSSWTMPVVSLIQSMFSGMSSVATISLPLASTGSVSTMDSTFLDCTSLTTVDMSRINTGSVTSFLSTFEGCTSMVSLDVSSMDTGSALNFESMFNNMPLSNVDSRLFDITAATNLDDMYLDSSMSTAVYDQLLIDWEAQGNTNSLHFHAGSSQHSVGGATEASMRAILDSGWIITSGGANGAETGLGPELSTISNYVSTGSEGNFAVCEVNVPQSPAVSGVKYAIKLVITGLNQGGFNLDFPSGGLNVFTNGQTEAHRTPGFNGGTVRVRTAQQPNAGATVTMSVREVL